MLYLCSPVLNCGVMVALGILVPSVSVRIAAVQQERSTACAPFLLNKCLRQTGGLIPQTPWVGLWPPYLLQAPFSLNCTDRIFDSLVRGLPKPLPRRFAPEQMSSTNWGPNPPDPLGRPLASVLQVSMADNYLYINNLRILVCSNRDRQESITTNKSAGYVPSGTDKKKEACYSSLSPFSLYISFCRTVKSVTS